MFGKRLMRLREARGLSVAETAKALELVPRTYTSYEKNEREPNAEVLIKIALYFGVSTDYLLGVNERLTVDISGLDDMQKQSVMLMINLFKQSNTSSNVKKKDDDIEM